MKPTKPVPIELRPVKDIPELRQAFARIAPLFLAAVDQDQDYRLDRLLEHFGVDRELMLIATDAEGRIHGAALAYRGRPEAVKLQALAVDPRLRRQRIGTRLIRELERRALQVGCTSIYLGAEEPARPFYAALGYHGRRSVLSKSLTGAALATSAETRRERLATLKAARNQRNVGQSDPNNHQSARG